MAKVIKRKYWPLSGLLILVLYFLVAARPVQQETTLVPRWVSSFEPDTLITLGDFSAPAGASLLPFRLDSRYGFFSEDGNFALNRIAQGNFDLSENFWAEHGANPLHIDVMNPHGELALTIENPRGFPLFMDGRVFLVGIEQNSLTAIDPAGQELWHHDFRAPIISIDAAAGRVVAGTLDGAIELLDAQGRAVIPPFEPGGSRLQAIYGVAISSDGQRLAAISGIDNQRFLLLEQAGDIFRVIHHEFLGSGFRRSVHINFADNDRRVAFEREGGIGLFDIASRTSIKVSLPGEVRALDTCGAYPYFFAVTAPAPGSKRFVTIRYPGVVIIDTPFQSYTAFLARRGNRVFLGGDSTMAAFELGKR